MPLIVLTGFPCSGKTQRAKQLEQYLLKRLQDEGRTMRIHIINDDTLHIRKDAYRGFRYQLYCIARAISTPHCVVHCGTPASIAKEWNKARDTDEKYDDTVLDELVTRYEEPDARNRWDAPLFTVIYDDATVPGDQIWDAVILRKPPPPNMSTISKPVSSTNYVYELDRVTDEIIKAVVKGQQEYGQGGGPMVMPGATTRVINPPRMVTLSELRRLRKQFVSINKMRTTLDTSRLAELFVDYLNTNLEQ
ncbi:chromatin associated protein KTI12-domain-containing protein [Dichotomocladium elegans]|nr:chromatin associated protein KTI12-domain-containing protein [Dichotomocladium elegans]